MFVAAVVMLVSRKLLKCSKDTSLQTNPSKMLYQVDVVVSIVLTNTISFRASEGVNGLACKKDA